MRRRKKVNLWIQKKLPKRIEAADFNEFILLRLQILTGAD